jgi:hypothetical protein
MKAGCGQVSAEGLGCWLPLWLPEWAASLVVRIYEKASVGLFRECRVSAVPGLSGGRRRPSPGVTVRVPRAAMQEFEAAICSDGGGNQQMIQSYA